MLFLSLFYNDPEEESGIKAVEYHIWSFAYPYLNIPSFDLCFHLLTCKAMCVQNKGGISSLNTTSLAPNAERYASAILDDDTVTRSIVFVLSESDIFSITVLEKIKHRI